MKVASFVVLGLLLSLVPACKGSDNAPAGQGSDAQSSSSSGAASASAKAASPATSASGASAGPVFAGKLTPALVAAYTSPPGLFGMTADAAIAAVSAKLGKPTAQDEGKVAWAAADDTTCRSYAIRLSGASVTSASSPPAVKAADFGEQWGKICLLEAGISPKRREFTGKTMTVAELVASKPSDQAVRVRGVLSKPRPAESSGASFLLTDEASPTASRSCNLELGAVSPKAFDGKTVVVECASTACNHCFFVK
ncbi:MAG: hypothetical protein U0183_20450 [Polyangiaceae bacterium]